MTWLEYSANSRLALPIRPFKKSNKTAACVDSHLFWTLQSLRRADTGLSWTATWEAQRNAALQKASNARNRREPTWPNRQQPTSALLPIKFQGLFCGILTRPAPLPTTSVPPYVPSTAVCCQAPLRQACYVQMSRGLLPPPTQDPEATQPNAGPPPRIHPSSEVTACLQQPQLHAAALSNKRMLACTKIQRLAEFEIPAYMICCQAL